MTDLVTTRQRVVRRVLAAAGIAVLAVGAYIIYRLWTEDRAAAPCAHLAQLDPSAVDALVGFTEHHVVELNLVDKSDVDVRGGDSYARCEDAFHILENASGNSFFEEKVSCVTSATTAAAASACFR